MSKSKFIKDKEDFAKSILPILKETFENENWTQLQLDDSHQFSRDGYSYNVSKDGKRVLWVQRKNMEENQDIGVRYKDVIFERSWIKLMSPFEKYKNSRHCYVMDNNYFINYYNQNIYKQNKCLICNWKEKEDFLERCKQRRASHKNMKTHNLTKTHSKNREMFINDFARITGLNYDVVKHILSFL